MYYSMESAYFAKREMEKAKNAIQQFARKKRRNKQKIETM